MFDDIIAGLMKAGGEDVPAPIDPNTLADRLIRKGMQPPAAPRPRASSAPADFGADDETVEAKEDGQPSLDFGGDDDVVEAKPPTAIPLPKPRPADAPQPPPDLGTPAPVTNGMPAVQPLDDQPFRTGGTVLDNRLGSTSGMLPGDKAYQQQQDTVAAAASAREAATAERIAAEERLSGLNDPNAPAAADRRHVQRALQNAKKRESDAIMAEATAKRTPLPTQSTSRDRGERVLKTVFGAGADVLNTLRGLSEFEPFEPSTPETRAYSDTLKKITDKAYREADRSARPDPTQEEQFGSKLTEGATSMGLFMAGGLAGRMLGMSGAAGSANLGAFQMGGSQLKEAEDAIKGMQAQIEAKKRDGLDFKADQDKLDWALRTKYLALFAGMGLGATEAIPIERFFNRLNQLSEGRVAHIITNSAAQSLEEVAQEIGQQVGSNAVAKLLYDEGRDIFKGVQDSAEVAAVLGGLMGAGAGMTGRRRSNVDIPAPESASPPPASPTEPQPTVPQPAARSTMPQDAARSTTPPTAAAAPDDAAILRAYGYSDEQIADMSEAQRKGEAEDARAAGVTVQPADGEVIEPARPGEFDQVPWTAADGNPWGMSDADYAKWRLQPENREAVEKWERDNKIIDADFGADDHSVGSRTAPITIESPADLEAVQVNAEPTEAQKEAGNYQKGHVRWNGLDISIENPKGSERSGKSADGTEWRTTLPAAYGYIRKTVGKDGDHVDIYLGDDVQSGRAFVVDQYDPQSGRFDEHKIMAGYPDEASALAAYDAAFSDGTGPQRRRDVADMSIPELKEWLAGDTTKPAVKQRDVRARPAPKSTDAVSLLEFIASKGGVKPTDDLRAMDLDGSHRVQVPGRRGFFGVVRPSGMDMDEMRELAQEAGYFPADANTTTRDLIDAIDAEMRGQRQQTIAEAGEPTRRDVERLEDDNARRDEELASYRSDLEAMLTEAGMPPDLINPSDLSLAVELMADEGLSADDALEQAALRNLETSGDMTSAEVDDIYNDFGVFDAVQPGPTPVDVASPSEESGSDDRSREEGGDAEPSADVSGAVEDRQKEQEEAPAAEEPGSTTANTEEAGHAGRAADQGVTRAEETIRRGRAVADKVNAREAERENTAFAELSSRAIETALDKIEEAVEAGDRKAVLDAARAAKKIVAETPQSIKDAEPDYWSQFNSVIRKMTTPGYVTGKQEFEAATTERTDAGEQTVLPGAEKIGDGELAQRKADEKLKAKKPQKPTDEGLFGDESKQTDLLDLKPKEPSKTKADTTEARASGPSDSESSLSEAFARRLAAGEKFPTIIAARKFAKDTFNVTDAKQIEEQLEFGVVQAARQIAQTEAAYPALVSLYLAQPRLGTRTSTSVRDQAYSTPIPLAYIASRLADVRSADVVYEPTAGNGALLVEATPDQTVIANEINPARAANLKTFGFNVTSKDASVATQANAILHAYEGADVVIANPPFGPVKDDKQSKVFDLSDIQKGYQTTEIDHAIVLHALEAMRGNGRAVLLVGGIAKKASSEKARSDAYNAKGKREFYKALYDRYNVVDHFTTAGELWERQGAGWPVDVIVIAGRGKSARQLPAVDVPKVYATWDQLGELLNDRDTRTARSAAGGAADRNSSGPARGDDDGLRKHSGERGGRDGRSEPQDAARVQPSPVPEQPKRGRARRKDEGPESEQRRERAGSDTGAAAERRAPRLDTFDAAFDAGLDATFGPKTTGEVAKSAAANAVGSADAAMAGLVQLFGGGKSVSSGLSFDNDTYAKAKPLFVQAAQKFADAIGDVTELVKRMVGEMHRLHGLTRDALEAMRPYLRRFVEEVQSGALTLKEPKPKVERLTPKQEAETENQVTYAPKSDAPGLGTLVPVNMRNSVADALDALEKRVGNLDQFVATELGYTAAELEEFLGAEQVDALALAIDNLKRGKGFIIGDQTGIGKGRVNAAIIRWAIKNGRVPIFVTEKPNLYGDMYRDLSQTDIQSFLGREPRIIATNALPQSLPLDDAGTVTIPATDAKKQNALLTSLSDPAALKRSYDVVFTTYNQMQSIGEKETARRSFLRGLAHDAILILDESHNAGGQAGERKKVSAAVGRAALVRQLIEQAQGTFYSSATYAKRPDVMDLYAATDMVMAVEKPTDLGEAIAKGGVPMQQVVAAMLAKAGQYIRRERSFAGVTYDTPIVETNREQYDGFSRALAAIQYFSDFIPAVVERLDKQLKAEAQATLGDNAVGSAGAHSVQFTSIMHNIINQMLLAAKVKPAATLAIEALERGEKPVLTVAATMETFMSQYADEMDLKHGDAVDATFGDVLLKYLDRTRTLLIRRPHLTGKDAVERRYLTDGELTPEARAGYAQAKKMIEALDLADLPISPIDAIKVELQKNGYKVGEITGRNTVLDYSGEAPVLRPRPTSETSIRGRRDTIRKFNAGDIDAIILNQAGATGLSLHASREFKDQSRRHMIIVQPEANIDTHMQMLGRVHRTGQVITPTYSQLIANIPAEKRPAAVLAKKMASLNANTTASRGGALTAKDVPDFLNEYGDIVAANYLLDHPDLNPRLAFPVKFKDSGALDHEDAMRKMTGRIPLLPLNEQEDLYEHLEEEYKALLAQMKAAGENSLEAQTFDLKAKTLETTEVVPAKEESSSPFAAPVTMEKASVALLGKPMTPAQVITRVYDELDAGRETAEGDVAHLALLLTHIEDGARHAWGRLSIEKEAKQRKTALADFDSYKRDVLDKIEDQDRYAKERAKLDAAKDRWSDIHQLARIGRRLTLKTSNGNLTAIVLKVEQKGQPKNPLALSTWKVTFAVADATRQATIPFSRLFMDGKANEDDLLGIELAEIQSWIESPKQTLERFETLQTEAREERYIATGNLLAAYDWLNMRGTIIHYTDDQGNIRQGILTSRDFDFVEHAVAKGKVLEGAQAVKDWIDAHPGQLLWSKDRVIRITRDNRGLPYTVSTERPKRTGGTYYLDSALVAITKDFVSRSGAMVANVGAGDILPAIKRMQELGAQFTISAEPPKPTKATDRLGDAGELASIRKSVRTTGIPAGARNVIAPHTADTAIKSHPDYRAAKSGDAPSALRMVEANLTPEVLQQIRALGSDVIYAPVIAVEQSGHNAIPMAMARYIHSELGGAVATDITQVNRSYHTGAKAMERLGARAQFEGPVQPGGRYVIVDDVTVMGSTIADLADHIQRNGGNIVGVVTLVNAGRTGVLTPTRATIKRIEERFGNEVRELFGLDPAGLTADEAAYLLNFRNADALRTRSAASERERTERLASKGISEPEAGGGVDNDPQASLAKVSTPRIDFDRPTVERSLTQLVHAIAGPDVTVRFADTIPLSKQPEGWGSFGATAQTASGTYLPAEHLITIALHDPKWGKSTLIDTAFHEAFHAVENRLLNDTEMEVFRREDARLRDIVHQAYGFSEDQVAEMQGYEIRAMAFEYYAGARARGIEPLGYHIAIRRAFERLMRLLREVKNYFQGYGFQSADSIFESVYEGRIADRAQREADGDVQYNIRPRGNLNTFESFEPLPENWRDWWKQPDLRWGDRVWGMIDAAFLPANRALGDKYVDMRRMQAAVEATGRQVGENIDMALSAVLFEGRTEKRLNDYWLRTWKPVLADMAKTGISREDMHWFLYARHAPERNAHIAEINDQMPDGGSGMTNDEAQEVMDRFRAEGKIEALTAAAQDVDRIVAHIRGMMVDDQLENERTVRRWEETYSKYVPLRGFEAGEESIASYAHGRGFDVRGPETHRALGRYSKADDVLSNLFMMGERTIIRGEQNRVARTAMRFMQSNPQPELYDVQRSERVLVDGRPETMTEQDLDLLAGERPVTVERVNRNTGMVETVTRVASPFAKNSFAVKIGGHTYYIRINHDGLLTALTNVGIQRLPMLVRAHGWLTRQFSALRTARNPDFFIPNLFRDVQDAAFTLGSEQRKTLLRHFAANVGTMRTYMAAAMGELMEGNGRVGTWARDQLTSKRLSALYEDWKRHGGQIAFMGIHDLDQAKKEIEAAFNETKEGYGKSALLFAPRLGKRLLKAIEYFNGAIEAGTRLAVYDAALKSGMTKAQAARLSKEATTNFNRKGIYSPYLNSFYAFFNARVQGSLKIVRLLRNSPIARAAGAGLMFAGWATTMWNLAVAPPDDEDEKKSEYARRKYWERERYFIIYMPGEKEPYRIPMGYGLQLFWMLGENIAMASQGQIKPHEAALNYLSTVVGAFSPFQAEGSPTDPGKWLRLIMPSVEMPLLELSTNENWRRRPIHPIEYRKGQKPHSEQYFSTTSPYAVDLARFLNRQSGGTAFKPGSVDLYPNDIQYMWEFAAGGLGQTASRSANVVQNWSKGTPTPTNQIPILRHFTGTDTEFAKSERYYEDRDKVRQGMSQVRQAAKDRRQGQNVDEATETIRERGGELGVRPGRKAGTLGSNAEKIFRDADKRLKGLRAELAKAKAGTDRDLVIVIQSQIRQAQDEARKAYKRMREAVAP